MSNLFHRNGTSPDPDIEAGCKHMLEMLSALADGSATGMIRWYAQHHVDGCPHCAAAVVGLQRLRVRLQAMNQLEAGEVDTPPTLHVLSVERRIAIEAAWNAVDGTESTV